LRLDATLAFLPQRIRSGLLALCSFPRLPLLGVRRAWLRIDLVYIHRTCWRRLVGIRDIAVLVY
jgi:hypothetical protein